MIAIGCSYTEYFEDSIYTDVKLDFPRWPELLANKLDMECVNLGSSGMGQEYMVAQLLDTLISEKNIGLVVIMWSEWQRLDFQFRPGKDGWAYLHPHRDNSEHERYPINRVGRIALLKYNNIFSATMRSLRFFLMTQKLLGDIPYLMIQGCNPLIDPLFLYPENKEVNRFPMRRRSLSGAVLRKIKNQTINIIIDSSITDEINEKKFIGWPVMQEIGGYSVDNILDNIDPKRKQLRISDEDTHPTGEGHKVIAKEIYNEYEKIYS